MHEAYPGVLENALQFQLVHEAYPGVLENALQFQLVHEAYPGVLENALQFQYNCNVFYWLSFQSQFRKLLTCAPPTPV